MLHYHVFGIKFVLNGSRDSNKAMELEKVKVHQLFKMLFHLNQSLEVLK